MTEYELIVVGGGPAGMAAALGAWSAGARRVLLLEQAGRLGGVLPQCVHTGFGLYEYGEELTGPEYAARQIARLAQTEVEVWTDAAVLKLENGGQVTVLSRARGLVVLAARAVVLAAGARERPAGALPITGTRPAGVFTAGQAQQLLNLGGYEIGRRAVILGSGDIGMIVARRLALEGYPPVAVIEQAPRCGGLARNRVQCLEEFGIPLRLSSTVTRLHGRARLEGVSVRGEDGGEELLPCDTLITSVGLLPEDELLEPFRGSELPHWLFLCGNAQRIYDLVDRAAADAARLGGEIVRWLQGGTPPQREAAEHDAVAAPTLGEGELLCLCCPAGCVLSAEPEGGVRGAKCEKGTAFYRQEQVEGRRYLTLVVTAQGTRVPLRTARPIPRALFAPVVQTARRAQLTLPLRAGQTAVADPAGCGCDLVVQCDCPD